MKTVIITNSKVKTPLGDGICQGHFAARDNNSQPAEERVLVRIPITEENQHLLGSSNCITPHAQQSALFVFAEGEIQL